MQNLIILLAVFFAAYMINSAMNAKGFSIFPMWSQSLGVIPLQMRAPMLVDNGSGNTSANLAASAAAAAALAASNNASNNPMVFIPGELNIMQLPQAFTYLNASTDAGATVATYAFNNAAFNAAATNNGGGAGTIVNTYGDGFVGTSYDQLMRSFANGMGVKFYGFTMHYVTTSTGAEYAAGLTAAAPTLLYYTGAGTAPVPKPMILNVGARNSQYLAGEMTVKTIFWGNATFQFGYNVTRNTTISLTLLCQPL